MPSPKKLAWFKFYPGDWTKDTRHLSLDAKGAWFDLICAMWDSPQRGSLADTPDGYARRIGSSLASVRSIIDVLSDPANPVCDRVNLPDGRIKLTCRRMVREDKRSAQSQKYGRLGGNPSLIYRVNPPDNPSANPPLESRVLEFGEEKRVQGEKGYPPIPEALVSAEFCAAWADFVEHRQQLSHPVTPIAVRNLFIQLEKMGIDRAVKAIRHSVANGWQGIFEPRQNGAAPTSKVDEMKRRART